MRLHLLSRVHHDFPTLRHEHSHTSSTLISRRLRRLLLLGYRTGLQVWDLTNVGAVSEVLNLRGARWGTVESAMVLPTPVSRGASGQDAFKAEGPLLGLMYVFL